jgi:hypothetical protein
VLYEDRHVMSAWYAAITLDAACILLSRTQLLCIPIAGHQRLCSFPVDMDGCEGC